LGEVSQEHRFKERMAIKRFTEDKEPKILSLQENENGEPFFSILAGKNRIAFKLSKGECAELGIKLLMYGAK